MNARPGGEAPEVRPTITSTGRGSKPGPLGLREFVQPAFQSKPLAEVVDLWQQFARLGVPAAVQLAIDKRGQFPIRPCAELFEFRNSAHMSSPN